IIELFSETLVEAGTFVMLGKLTERVHESFRNETAAIGPKPAMHIRSGSQLRRFGNLFGGKRLDGKFFTHSGPSPSCSLARTISGYRRQKALATLIRTRQAT